MLCLGSPTNVQAFQNARAIHSCCWPQWSHSRTYDMMIIVKLHFSASKTKENQIEASPLGWLTIIHRPTGRQADKSNCPCQTGSDHQFSAVCWNATCGLRRCDLDSLEGSVDKAALSIYLSIYLIIYLSIYLSIYLVYDTCVWIWYMYGLSMIIIHIRIPGLDIPSKLYPLTSSWFGIYIYIIH